MEYKFEFLPLAVLVHVSVALHAVFFNQEFHSLIERSCHTWRLLSQQNFDWVVAGKTHYVVWAGRVRAAFTVWAVHHSILKIEITNLTECSQEETGKKVLLSVKYFLRKLWSNCTSYLHRCRCHRCIPSQDEYCNLDQPILQNTRICILLLAEYTDRDDCSRSHIRLYILGTNISEFTFWRWVQSDWSINLSTGISLKTFLNDDR